MNIKIKQAIQIIGVPGNWSLDIWSFTIQINHNRIYENVYFYKNQPKIQFSLLHEYAKLFTLCVMNFASHISNGGIYTTHEWYTRKTLDMCFRQIGHAS